MGFEPTTLCTPDRCSYQLSYMYQGSPAGQVQIKHLIHLCEQVNWNLVKAGVIKPPKILNTKSKYIHNDLRWISVLKKYKDTQFYILTRAVHLLPNKKPVYLGVWSPIYRYTWPHVHLVLTWKLYFEKKIDNNFSVFFYNQISLLANCHVKKLVYSRFLVIVKLF